DLMRRRKVDSLMVTDDQRHFVGIVLLAEVQSALEMHDQRPIGAFAARREAWVAAEDRVMTAIRHMLTYRLDAIPVCHRDGTVIGIVTRGALAGVLDGALGLGATATALEA
ncbi:MAG: CBS domain-containing protein, partial [Alicyclobacillus sp.]|nr:CBS domain-containing protein [Alicyclobacillus sp.]